MRSFLICISILTPFVSIALSRWIAYNEGMNKLNDPEILRELYISQRLDTAQIAEQLEVGFNTVVRALQKFGIKKEQRFPVEFTAEQKSVLYGGLLGDSNLAIQPNGINACLRIEHSIKQESYLKWKFEYFRPWINADEPTIQKQRISKGKSCPSIKFTTVAVPLFTEAYNLFYQEGKKIVTKAAMDKIDALALAVWFQDDGTYFYNSANRSNTMRISTHGFSEFENNMLLAYFSAKWKLNPKIILENKGEGKKYFYLKFNAEDARKLVEIIRPYVISSMQYKLDPKAKAGDFCQ